MPYQKMSAVRSERKIRLGTAAIGARTGEHGTPESKLLSLKKSFANFCEGRRLSVRCETVNVETQRMVAQKNSIVENFWTPHVHCVFFNLREIGVIPEIATHHAPIAP